MISTKDFKIKYLGIAPLMKDETGVLKPQELVAFSGLLTYSGKSIEAILKETRDKGQDIEKKIRVVLRKSSLKGHASMATTPAFSFSYEASKFIDSAFTGLIFASAIMASGRRTDTTPEDIVYPVAISGDKESLGIYTAASQKCIEALNNLLTAGVGKDEASKVLQYGIYGTGIIQFPVESLVSLRREYEAEKEWMPEDVGFLIEAIEKELKDSGVDLLYATRLAAPRNTYPYPNIFKNPDEINFAREIAAGRTNGENFKIVGSSFAVTPEMERRFRQLEVDTRGAVKDKDLLKSKWMKLLEDRQKIVRDYGLSANIKVFSSVAWRVWGDKKRHRTVPMVVDSVYYCARRAAAVFAKFGSEIKSKSLTHEIVDKIDAVYSVPPAIARNNDFLYEYLEAAAVALGAYSALVKMGIKERDAIFVVPRGLRLDLVQDYNLYNLVAGYYPLRICSTAEEELRRLSIKEVTAIKSLLQEKKMEWLAWHIAPKCHAVGFCLEQDSCGAVKGLVPGYDAAQHKEMHDDLEVKFKEALEKLS